MVSPPNDLCLLKSSLVPLKSPETELLLQPCTLISDLIILGGNLAEQRC